MAKFKVIDNRGRTVGIYSDESTAQAVARDVNAMQRDLAVKVGLLNSLHLSPAQVDDAERAMPNGFYVPRSGGGRLLEEGLDATFPARASRMLETADKPRMTGGVVQLRRTGGVIVGTKHLPGARQSQPVRASQQPDAPSRFERLSEVEPAHHVHSVKLDAKGRGTTGETNGHTHTVNGRKALEANGHTHGVAAEGNQTVSTSRGIGTKTSLAAAHAKL